MWEKVRLEEICEINIGKTPSRNIPEYWGGDNKWIAISDLKGDRYVDETKERITDLAIEKSGIKVIPKDTLLYSFKLSIGKVAITKSNIFSNEAIASLPIIDKSRVSLEYLYWAMQTLQLEGVGDKAVMGVTLNKTKLKNLEIPLPPLPVQQRIADMLDKADALRRKDQELLKKYDELAQAIFIDMFGDPVKNEKGWEVKKLGEIAQLQGGYAFKSKDYKPDGVRLVKITNVHKNELIWTDVDYLPPIFLENYKSYSLDIGDIVMAMTRPVIKSLDGIKVVCVTKSDLPCLLNQRVGRFVIKKGELNNIFLYSSCNTQYFKDKIEKLSSISLQPNISSKQVEEIKIPVPPLDLQEAFARKIEAINLLKAKTNKEKSAKLFQSLLQRAFKGDLGQRY